MASSPSCDRSGIRKRLVRLLGLHSACDEEYIRLFFEDVEHLGEIIEIKHVYMDTAQNSAVIEPKDPGAVDIIIDKQPFLIEKASVTAEIFSPLTLEVFGPTKSVCDTYTKKLRLFLKNEKRSGGGKIDQFTIIKPGTAMVKYTSEEVAERVAKRKTLEFMESTLDVRLYHPKNYKSNTVLMSGLPDGIDKEYLELYFEDDDKFGESIPAEIELDEINHSAVLKFNDVDSVVSFMEHEPHKMDGNELTIKWLSKEDKVELQSPKIPATCIVKLEGPTNIICPQNESHLMLFFKNEKRSGGGTVKSLEFIEDGIAHITCENEEAADKIVKKKEFTIKGKTVIAKPCTTTYEDACVVEVKCRDFSQDRFEYLKSYFNNEMRSGGENVVESSANIQTNTAYFKYRSSQVAKRVCYKDHDEGITVKLYKGECPWSDITYTEKEPVTQPAEEAVTSCVKVRDVPESISLLTLELYFENENRSGGGTIENIAHDFEDPSVIYVKFESPKVAEDVVKREHTIDGHKLQVRLCVQAPYDNTKVLVYGLPEDFSKDSLFFFLEAKSNTKPKYISYHVDLEDVALVTLESELDFKSLQRACAENAFEKGVHLEISRVPFSTIIWVGNLRKNTNQLTVALYFESKKASNGGRVEKVVMNQSDESCLVYFENYEDVDVVIKRKHQIENQMLLVKRYESCIKAPEDVSQERTLKIPKPIEIQVDSSKCKFIENSYYRHVIEEDLLKSHTKVIWPADLENAIKLECTLTKQDKGAFQLVREWETRTVETFDKYLTSICVYEIRVQQVIWEKAKQVLTSINISNPNEVCVFSKSDQCIFQIVGKTVFADSLHRQIKSCIDDIMKNHEKEKEVFKMTPLHLQLLQKIGFDALLIETFSDLSVYIEDYQLILEGSPGSIRDAQKAIVEKTKEFACTTVAKASSPSIKLYESTATQQFLEEKFQRYQITAAWVIAKENIAVCCSESKLLHQCIAIIKESVKENVIDIRDLEIPDLVTQNWKNKIAEIVGTDPGKVLIILSQDNTKFTVCATDDIVDNVLKQMNDYIQSNSLETESVACKYDVLMLLQKHHRKDIEGKEDDSSIQISFDQNCESIKLKCPRPMMRNMLTRVHEILRKVRFRQHTVSKPGIDEFMKQEKGKKHLEAIEAAYLCRVVIDGPEESSQSSDLVARCEYNNRRIDAVVCDITEQEVGMIINPDDEYLRLLGGLGRAIVTKGGESIKRECSDHRGLKDYEVFVSTAGKLKCSCIAHVKSNEWSDGKKGETSYLENVVMKCLLEANTRRLKSVAIPAIGCGVNRFPVDVATKSIVNALKRFCMENKSSAIEWIYLCDTDMTRVRGFSIALSDVFGPEHVKVTNLDEHSTAGQATIVQDISAGQAGVSKRRTLRNLNIQPTAVPVQKAKFQTKIVKGELACQKVDVIVNNTSKDLNLSNGLVSQSLLNAAGNSLQEEVRSKYPKGLEGFKVAVSEGHNLKCKAILHTSIPQCNRKDTDQCKQNIKEIVRLCLEETDKLKCASVAFPAIGTGGLKYPRKIVAKEMFLAVDEYSMLHPQSRITEVTFVLYQSDTKTISAFETASSHFLTMLSPKQGIAVTPATVQAPSSNSATAPSQNNAGIFMIGNIAVSAKVGDLLKENIDCIVNGTDEQFNKGKMIKTILSKGGKALREEVDNQKDEMKNQKIVCTSAPGLPCKRIIHVVVPPINRMSETIQKSLDLAERIGSISSVGIPAMDVGENKKDIRNLATQMMLGVKQFSKLNPQKVQEVRFVLFNSEFLGIFQAAVEEAYDYKTTYEKLFGKKGKPITPNITRIKPVTFNIYSLSLDIIEDVKKKIEVCLDEEMLVQDFNDSVIENLDYHQVSELQSILSSFQVHVEIDQPNASIKIAGIKDNVHNAVLEVHAFLRDVSEMDWMEQLVQWHAIINGRDKQYVSEYPKNVNALLEKAYKKQKRTETFVNPEDGKTYLVDFIKMEETPENDPTDVAKVIRRDRRKGGFAVEFPLSWDEKPGNINVVTLNTTSPEFSEMAAIFLSSTGKYNLAVEKIQRIQNKTLWEQYASKKKEMEEFNEGQINERHLWHGTSEDSIDSINMYGFNRSFCGKNATKYGEGVYFAPDADYSYDYSPPDANDVRRMYYCRVLTGDYALGVEGMRVPPANRARGLYCIYNSVVNDLQKPDMFVIFHDSQAYPEYLIYFKR